MDLKFRISPPHMDSELWCATAIVLQIPHRNTEDLLSGFQTFVECCKRYINMSENFMPRNNECGCHPTYVNLKKYESD